MIILVAMLAVAVIIIVTGVMLGLRTWVRDVAAVENRLRAPETHTLDYVVPNGQDPAPLRAALAEAHFTAITADEGGTEYLMIACEEQDRARVREVLEHAVVGTPAPDAHPGRVRFRDED